MHTNRKLINRSMWGNSKNRQVANTYTTDQNKEDKHTGIIGCRKTKQKIIKIVTMIEHQGKICIQTKSQLTGACRG